MILSMMYMVYLIVEYRGNIRTRRTIDHVIHVNGTRGKSSVCRLIDAGLRAGGYRVLTKTTGTSPRIINVNGEETEIIRKGKANIKEQIKILRLAEKQGAEVIVIECMAVNPDLQYISEDKILRADIGIVTNVRRDHLEEMGPRLEDVAESLGTIMPKEGTFITGDERFYNYYKELGNKRNTDTILVENIQENYGFDFNENAAIALEVCKALKIEKATAIDGMRKYKKDPGALKVYEISTETNNKVHFINALAVNDPDSIIKIYNLTRKMKFFCNQKFILLFNNRVDRAYRMKQHVDLIREVSPREIWITGSLIKLMKRELISQDFRDENIRSFNKCEDLNFKSLKEDTIIFAVGNIGGVGEAIISQVEGIGEIFAG